MKLIILSCLAACSLITLVGCADEQTTSTTNQSSSVPYDAKDMHSKR